MPKLMENSLAYQLPILSLRRTVPNFEREDPGHPGYVPTTPGRETSRLRVHGKGTAVAWIC